MSKTISKNRKIHFQGITADNKQQPLAKTLKSQTKQALIDDKLTAEYFPAEKNKKLLGITTESPRQISKKKTYKTSELLLDVYKKISGEPTTQVLWPTTSTSLIEVDHLAQVSSTSRPPVFSPKGNLAIYCTDTGDMSCVQISDQGTLEKVGAYHFDIVGYARLSGPAFSPDGKHVVVCTNASDDHKIYAFNVLENGNLKLTGEFMASGCSYAQPAFSPDGKYVVVGSSNKTVYCLKISDGGVLDKVGEHELSDYAEGSIGFSKDSKYVVVGTCNGKIYSLEIGQNGKLGKSDVHRTNHYLHGRIAFSPKGNFAMVGMHHLSVCCLRLSSRGNLKKTDQLTFHTNLPMGKVFTFEKPLRLGPIISPNGKHVLVELEDKRLCCLEISKNGEIQEIGHIQLPALLYSEPMFSPDGQHFVFVTHEKKGYCYHLNEQGTMSLTSIFDSNTIGAHPAFSLEGFLLAQLSNDMITCLAPSAKTGET